MTAGDVLEQRLVDVRRLVLAIAETLAGAPADEVPAWCDPEAVAGALRLLTRVELLEEYLADLRSGRMHLRVARLAVMHLGEERIVAEVDSDDATVLRVEEGGEQTTVLAGMLTMRVDDREDTVVLRAGSESGWLRLGDDLDVSGGRRLGVDG